MCFYWGVGEENKSSGISFVFIEVQTSWISCVCQQQQHKIDNCSDDDDDDGEERGTIS